MNRQRELSYRRARSATFVIVGLIAATNCGGSLPAAVPAARGGADGTAGASGHGGGGTGGQPGECPFEGVYPNCSYGDTAGYFGTGRGGDSGSGGTGGAVGGRGGTGGAVGGSGGVGGIGGSAGVGSGGGPTLAAPSCLQDLFAACPIDGECHPRAADGGGAGYCSASGAAAEQLQVHGCGPGIDGGVSRDEIRVYKPDGSICFTFEALWHYSCEFASWSWTNAAGETVATGSGSWGQGTNASVQCAAGGAAASCALATCPPVPDLTGPFGPFGPATCSPGSCP